MRKHDLVLSIETVSQLFNIRIFHDVYCFVLEIRFRFREIGISISKGCFLFLDIKYKEIYIYHLHFTDYSILSKNCIPSQNISKNTF